ncbi:hypothetical protein HUU05_22510, partial [candidate division KSB1 bacterium]|nr:hypothetical protein [candidate division KSB1 bacterium]
QIAQQLKTTIESALGLTVSVGIGTTKTLVKIASNAENFQATHGTKTHTEKLFSVCF